METEVGLQEIDRKSQETRENLAKKEILPKMRFYKHQFSYFYRPSIWKCLDCGYEGAFIVEDSRLAGKIQKRYQNSKGRRI